MTDKNTQIRNNSFIALDNATEDTHIVRRKAMVDYVTSQLAGASSLISDGIYDNSSVANLINGDTANDTLAIGTVLLALETVGIFIKNKVYEVKNAGKLGALVLADFNVFGLIEPFSIRVNEQTIVNPNDSANVFLANTNYSYDKESDSFAPAGIKSNAGTVFEMAKTILYSDSTPVAFPYQINATVIAYKMDINVVIAGGSAVDIKLFYYDTDGTTEVPITTIGAVDDFIIPSGYTKGFTESDIVNVTTPSSKTIYAKVVNNTGVTTGSFNVTLICKTI